jgi:hypothetical protein
VAFTYQTIVDLARIPLNDSDKVRYSDAQLMMFANQAMLAMSKRRPDLFIGQFSSMPNGEAGLADSFPIDPSHSQQVADWITGRAEMTDDEHADSGRAAQYVNMFTSEAPL